MSRQSLSKWLLEKLVAAGAQQAEVFMQEGSTLQLEVREGKLERISQAQTAGAGVRTIVNQRLSFVHTSDFSKGALTQTIKKAIALAEQASPSEFNKLPTEKPRKIVMEIFDSDMRSVSIKRKVELLTEMEAAALKYDPSVKRSEHVGYSEVSGTVGVFNTNGLSYSYDASSCQLGVGAVAERNGRMETGYEGWTSCYFKRLPPPAELGKEAAKRAVALLGSKPVSSQKVPVVFDPQVGFSLLASLAQALRGDNVNKRISYLGERLGEKIGSELVTIRDNGKLPEGPVSRPIDAEGVSTSDLTLFEKGILKNFIYDYFSALRAGKKPTGNAVRESYMDLPQVGFSNYYMEKGNLKPEDIIKDTANGFYVTKLAGWWLGINPASPDYSSAASGLWIKNGQLAQPVSGVTIASTVLDMLAGIDAVADDLIFKGDISCPTFRVREMALSGPGQ
jgi:PmbA protein